MDNVTCSSTWYIHTRLVIAFDICTLHVSTLCNSLYFRVLSTGLTDRNLCSRSILLKFCLYWVHHSCSVATLIFNHLEKYFMAFWVVPALRECLSIAKWKKHLAASEFLTLLCWDQVVWSFPHLTSCSWPSRDRKYSQWKIMGQLIVSWTSSDGKCDEAQAPSMAAPTSTDSFSLARTTGRPGTVMDERSSHTAYLLCS